MSKIRKSVLAGLTALLVTSLALNVVLFNAAKSFYTRIQAVRLDPLGDSSRRDAVVAPASQGPQLCILGDSRAEEWHLPPGFKGFTVLNSGIGSQTTAQILGRIHSDLHSGKPDVVLLQAGVNDLKTIPLFPERRHEIIATCKTNLSHIVTHCSARGALVVVSTVFPVGTPPLARRPVWSADVAAGVREVNMFLKSLSSTNVIVLDAYASLVDEDGLIKNHYRKDTLHLNESGYDVLNAQLSGLLETRTRWAPQAESTVPLKPAPSAPSDVR